MALLNFPATSPPDNFTYVQFETGARWETGQLSELEDLVIAHRQWKGLTPTDRASVRLDIERQLCQRLPPGWCHAEPNEDFAPFEDKARAMTVENLLDFSKAALRFIESGGELVPKTESERRAQICRGCQFNRPSPCVICTPFFKAIDAMIPKGRDEPGVSACGLCSCSLRAKVLLPLATIRADDNEQRIRYPTYCWQYINGEAQKAPLEVPA